MWNYKVNRQLEEKEREAGEKDLRRTVFFLFEMSFQVFSLFTTVFLFKMSVFFSLKWQ